MMAIPTREISHIHVLTSWATHRGAVTAGLLRRLNLPILHFSIFTCATGETQLFSLRFMNELHEN